MEGVRRTIIGDISLKQRAEWYLIDNYYDVVEPDNLWNLHQSIFHTRDEFFKCYYRRFRELWNPLTLDWSKRNVWLAESAGKYFPIWWDPYRFSWTNVRWEPGSYDIHYLMITNCATWFKVWFDKESWDYENLSLELCTHVRVENFNIWWDDRFTMCYDTSVMLEDYYQDYKDKWAPKYVEWKLENE